MIRKTVIRTLPAPIHRRWHSAYLAVLACVALFGCGRSDSDTSSIDERWYSIHLAQGKVGHAVIRTRCLSQGGETLIETATTQEFNARRGNDSARTRMTFVVVETPEGALRSFEQRIEKSGEPLVVKGRVVGEELHIDNTTARGRIVRWPAGALGPGCWERLLARRPLAVGQSHSYISLDELSFTPANETLSALPSENTSTPGGVRRLRRVDQVVTPEGGQPRTTRIWLDDDGRVVKLASDLGPIESHLVSREEAVATPKEKVDLVFGVLIPVKVPFADARPMRTAHFRIRVERGDPRTLFSQSPTQAVRRIDERTVDVFVRAMRPDTDLSANAAENLAFAAESSPGAAADTAANAMLQSDDPAVAALAAGVAQNEKRPWPTAVALERHCHDAIQNVSYEQMFASAAEVARSRQGDCTEHAVLLAAVLRARKIPARVAVGVIYLPDRAAFGFHMWTEGWIADRWIPLDATLAAGGTPADRITLATTNLDAGLSDRALLRVPEVLGAGATIEVVASEAHDR